ncbi:hypothetical protein BD310DRAFT_1037442 [Dichomitus squalens]|uniref:R3H domain-containing protein n=1 Tax=Dichomitus squalens TaxID=114155 RepID=A0A4Q9Q3K5_9APHY|nr:hypothetical protein BD310DRAFT_1037442 [Dichomitus squalens]
MPDTAAAPSTTAPASGNADPGAQRHRPRRPPQHGKRAEDHGPRPATGDGPEGPISSTSRGEGASRPRWPRAPKSQDAHPGEPSRPRRGGPPGGKHQEKKAQGDALVGHDAPKGEGSNRQPRPKGRGGRPGEGHLDAAPSSETSTPKRFTKEKDTLLEGTPASRNLRQRRRKFGGELTDGRNESVTQDAPPTEKYRSTAPKLKADDLTSRLTEELSTPPYPDCLICFAPIIPMQPTWSCSPSHPALAATDDEGASPGKRQPADISAQCCWMTFHLKCIKPWAVRSVKDVEEAWRARGEERQGDWRCPGCQSKRSAIPSSYWCFCGSTPDPKPPRLATPHSCANPCTRTRVCGHPCSLNCHPGPCPPCQVTTSHACYCGKETISFRCSNLSHGRATTELSCHQFCERKLSCGNHVCQEICHPGKCSPCLVRETARCYCGKVEKDLGCGEGEDKECAVVRDGQEEKWVGRFACEETCDRPFDCGIHHCKKSCHVPSPTPAPCPRSPKIVTHCPCGKYALAPESAPFFPPGALLTRTACTDPVPTCASTCMKPLEGCEHVCSAKCHTGHCPPCSIRIVRPCRCGSTTREVLCSEDQAMARARARGESGPDSEILCERPCHILRECGRHQCNRICCPLAAVLASLAKGKGKKKPADALVDPEGWHQCDLVCGKPLSCGNHHCAERDHKGACPPCLRSSFDEMVCYCGRTVLEPPIPCGTRMACMYPCPRPPPLCGHPKMPHLCHEDPTPCPPCVHLTTKQCACGKKMVDHVKCSQAQEKVSCGATCGKLLPCGFHHCERSCHADACGDCHATCGKPRKLCLPALHACQLSCHAPASCDESEPCRAIVTITCPCGRIRQPIPCGRSLSNPGGRESTQQLKCSNECAIAKRNALLAEALGINPDRDGRANQVTYSDELASFARANVKFCALVEKSFADFLATDKKSQVLPHMPEQKRKFVHDLAAVYRMDTQMVDQEPHRSVQLIRRVDSRVPAPLLSASVGGASGLGKLADLRSAGGLQSLSRPSFSRASLAPVSQPAPGTSSGRGWTSVVARPPQSASPAPSSWGTPPRTQTPVRPAPSPGPIRTAPITAPALAPVATPLSPQDVPDDWEDVA